MHVILGIYPNLPKLRKIAENAVNRKQKLTFRGSNIIIKKGDAKTMEMEIRLNKYLSDAGACSRREADRLIEAGMVTVDGKQAATGMKVSTSRIIRIGEKVIKPRENTVLLAVNKPAGIVCTQERREKHNIISFLNYPIRITYAGRLDKDSEGLLLMTNNGDIINQMMRARNYHEKEYLVTVDKPVTPEFLAAMAGGVRILETVTRECKVERTGRCSFRIILTQGLNRQIRRMCEALGYRVTRLVRTRIMNIRLGSLKSGEYRRVTDAEEEVLHELLCNPEGEPAMLR